MRNKYAFKNLILTSFSLLLLMMAASCKKDAAVTKTPAVATPVSLGMDEYYIDSTTYKILAMTISKVGTQVVDDDLLFDTGSGGMVMDADGVLPASMIASSGFTFTGDSTVVDGITITNQTSIIEYGDDDASTVKVYGNLAYAPVTIGQPDGQFSIKRLPFFLYYKAVDAKGNTVAAHEFDIFGVSPEYDLTFSNNVSIQSPFTYYTPGNGLTQGFKMGALGTTNFSFNGNHVAGVVTLGLTAADVASSSSFVISTLTNFSGAGYVPVVPGTITYGTKATTSYVLFDTGTEPYDIIEDKTGPGTATFLPVGTNVDVETTSGFDFKYTTAPTEYLTYVENPNTSGADVSILGIEFFLTNSYLIDYTDHLLGVKNN